MPTVDVSETVEYEEDAFEGSVPEDELNLEADADDTDEVDHEQVSNDSSDEAVDLESPETGTEETMSIDADRELEFDSSLTESVLELDGPSDESNIPLLDAWYADYTDPTTQMLVRRQEGLGEEAAEVVIGKDDRVKVKNTKPYPWRTICSLLITAADNSRWIGTGWLVGHRTVITAGHCVYIHSRGGWVKNVEVIPGRNGNQRPYGSVTATSFRSVKGWTNEKKRTRDYGAIILPRSRPLGKSLGYFGYANYRLTSLLGSKVNLSGYPGDKPTGTQWWHARRIKFVTLRTLVYNIDTFGGQSGSPVWRLKDGKRYAVGIHTNGSSSGNSATRITKPVFNNIKKWKSEGMV